MAGQQDVQSALTTVLLPSCRQAIAREKKKTQSRNSTYHAQNAKMGGGGGADVENDHQDGIYCEDGGRERPEGRPGAAAPRTAETVWMCCARGSEAWY